MSISRWKGDNSVEPQVPAPEINRTEAEKARFWMNVDPDAPGGCWVWKLKPHWTGYGKFKRTNTEQVLPHRYAYELLFGPIPEGLTLDHLCRNTLCVNPAHLDPVTIGVNILRGNSPSARHARKTHCKRGHPFSGDNLHIRTDGARICMACRRAHTRAWRERKQATSPGRSPS